MHSAGRGRKEGRKEGRKKGRRPADGEVTSHCLLLLANSTVDSSLPSRSPARSAKKKNDEKMVPVVGTDHTDDVSRK